MNQSEEVHGGVLEIDDRGGGRLRDIGKNLRADPLDPVVPQSIIDEYFLTQGDLVVGSPGASKGRARTLARIITVEGEPVGARRNGGFDDLTAIDPTSLIRLENGREPLGPRVIDLLIPVGKGQRGLIVAPPRSGKTILLQQAAAAIVANHPEIELLILLVDERPEEVTEMRRSGLGRVFWSSSDRDTEEHIRIARLVIDRGKSIAAAGKHAVILLDSLTRLARAHNKHSSTGRTMTGGVDIKALDVPKRLFGAARALAEGGSLTILASVLIDTGSRMDELIFQEFKGTGNLELVLDRTLANRRVWPAIDLAQSGTRKEEKLLDPVALKGASLLRRVLSTQKPVEAMESLLEQLAKSDSNADFLEKIVRTSFGAD